MAPLDLFEEIEAMEKRLALLETELGDALRIITEVSNQIGDPYGFRDSPKPEDYDIMEREANNLAVLAYRLMDVLEGKK
jgi:hypothetical protein